MNERDETRLRDMLGEIYRVQEFLEGEDQETFFQNMMLAYAVIRAITIVGEAANHISEQFQQEHPEIPWHNIVGMRNRIVHGYGSTDLKIVWEVATRNLPTLRLTLE